MALTKAQLETNLSFPAFRRLISTPFTSLQASNQESLQKLQKKSDSKKLSGPDKGCENTLETNHGRFANR